VSIEWPNLLSGHDQKVRCRMCPWKLGTRRHRTAPEEVDPKWIDAAQAVSADQGTW